VFVGFILTKMLKIGAAIIGAIAGGFIAAALYNLFFFYSDSSVLFWVMVGLSALIMAYLSKRYYDKIVIFGTAFIGSYSFFRGISLFAGYFPSEYEVYMSVSGGSTGTLPW